MQLRRTGNFGAASRKCSGRSPMATDAPGRPGQGRRIARNTAFFSFATGLSRCWLAREVVAELLRSPGAMSAFQIAFQVPT